MKLTAGEIAKITGGELLGPAGTEVAGMAPLEHAGPSHLAFLADPAAAPAAAASKAGVLLAPEAARDALKPFAGAAIFVKNPRYAFMLALRHAEKEVRPRPAPGVHPSACVHPAAKLGGGVHIGPCAVIEEGVSVGEGAVIEAQCYLGRNAVVGAGTRLYPGVKVMDACEIGAKVIIHANAVVGSDGYGYTSPAGKHEKIPQIGKVVIEDEVEIGANTAIDRAALEATVIGAGTKIDNLVHIAHNVRLGRGCLLMAHTSVAGSSLLGDGVIMGGHAAVSDHVRVGDGTIVMGMTGVISDLGPGQLVFGHVARPRMEAMRIEVLLGKLPQMHKTLSAVKKKLGL